MVLTVAVREELGILHCTADVACRGQAVIAALAERTRAIEDNLFKPRDQGEYQKEQRRRRAAEAEVNGKGDLPGVGITADEATRTLNLGGHTKIMGDLTVEGSIYVQNFTRVRGGGCWWW